MKDVFIIPDLQAPFHHRDALPFLFALADHYGFDPDNPNDEFVCIGDEIEQHAVQVAKGRVVDPDLHSANDEFQMALDQVMYPLYERFPRMKANISNHTQRPWLKAVASGLPRRYMKAVRDVMEAPEGWSWHMKFEINAAAGDTRDQRWVQFEHGMGFSGKNAALTAAQTRHKKMVIGHVHAWAGVQYWASEDNLLWGMNVGSLVDRKALAFRYGKFYRNKPILSAGVIINGEPHVHIMQLRKSGRWDNKIHG